MQTLTLRGANKNVKFNLKPQCVTFIHLVLDELCIKLKLKRIWHNELKMNNLQYLFSIYKHTIILFY